MDRFEKIQDIVGAVLFGSIGITALVAATFFGARHQFAIAALCAMMVFAFVAEIRRENRKAGIKPRLSAKTIRKQLLIALSRRYYPTPHIPMKYWVWRWDRRGNVKYQHWRTLWKYIAGNGGFSFKLN